MRLQFGVRSALPETRAVHFRAGSEGLSFATPRGLDLENGDTVGVVSHLIAGGGDVDGLEIEVRWPTPGQPPRQAHSIWQYLLDQGSPGAARLRDDPVLRPDAPVLGGRLSEDGTRGFSVGLEQLRRHRAMWIPEHQAFVTLADEPVDAARHVASLEGRRLLDRVKSEPEASLAQFRGEWEDVGDPVAWRVPWETQWRGTRGHLVITAAAHGSLYKFAIDREGRVRPDFASIRRGSRRPGEVSVSWMGCRSW